MSARAALLHYGPKPAENGQFVLILGRLLAIDLPTDTEPHGTVGTLLFHCQTLRLFGTGFARSELEDCALNWAPRMGRPNCGSRSNTRSHFPSHPHNFCSPPNTAVSRNGRTQDISNEFLRARQTIEPWKGH